MYFLIFEKYNKFAIKARGIKHKSMQLKKSDPVCQGGKMDLKCAEKNCTLLDHNLNFKSIVSSELLSKLVTFNLSLHPFSKFVISLLNIE